MAVCYIYSTYCPNGNGAEKPARLVFALYQVWYLKSAHIKVIWCESSSCPFSYRPGDIQGDMFKFLFPALPSNTLICLIPTAPLQLRYSRSFACCRRVFQRLAVAALHLLCVGLICIPFSSGGFGAYQRFPLLSTLIT